ncbi:hypothetical protein Plec18170_004418 [Paecilomyces lecythidis]
MTRVGNPFTASSWKKTAAVNVVVVCILSILLFAFLITGCVRAGGLNDAWTLYHGPCKTANRINLLLHLFLNVLATLVLASSNFFMQIINAPSRDELDKAHQNSRWMDIGVPALRNFLSMPKTKFLCWLVLGCSSVPLHLFFNSIFFEVRNVDSMFGLTIAAEPFIQGEEYFPPGASLWNTVVPFNCSVMPVLPEWEDHNKLCIQSSQNNGVWFGGSGSVDMAEWLDKSSEMNRNISYAAKVSRASWERLNPARCRSEFLYCGGGQGLTSYRNVVMVVDNGVNKTTGWTTDQVFPKMSDNDTAFWEHDIPDNKTNSLWFHNTCHVRSQFENGMCYNSCKTSLGFDSLNDETTYIVNPHDDRADPSWVYPFWGNRSLDAGILDYQMRTGFDRQYNMLNVSYCLAERIEEECKIGVSNILVLAVVLCVSIKVAQCIFVMVHYVSRANESPLVTPGDAMNSLLRRPDPMSTKMCTLEMRDLQTTWARFANNMDKSKGHSKLPTGVEYLASSSGSELFAPQVRQWRHRKIRYFWTVATATWVYTYVIFVVVFSVALYYFSKATNHSFKVTGTFGNSGMNNFVTQDEGSSSAFVGDFYHLVLLANTPQLLLSLIYLTFNSLITQICMAKEWASFSTTYQPLRVTDPKGEQVSTYRLQLPYAWSIPTILLSILLHYLLSSTCYVFVADGGFYSSTTGGPTMEGNNMGLSDHGFVGLGYSPIALLAFIVVFVAAMCVPLVLGLRRLPGDMVVVGSNSFAMAAACHASTISKVKIDIPEETEYDAATSSNELGNLIVEEIAMSRLQEHDQPDPKNQDLVLSKLAESKLKWGVVTMPPEFYEEFKEDMEVDTVEHLSFGVKEDDVQKPIYGKWYA